MICNNCGESLGEGAKFCRRCGMAIDNEEREQETETNNEDNTLQNNEIPQNEQSSMRSYIPVTTTDGYFGNKEINNSVILSVTEVVNTGYNAHGNYDKSIETAKANAVNSLRQRAFENDCYAIVGLRFEFIHFVTNGYVHTYISAYATGIKNE